MLSALMQRRPAMTSSDYDDKFSVYWWDKNGFQHEELRFVGAAEAMQAVRRLTTGPAIALGAVRRVIVTDDGDFCNFEWKDGRVTFDGRELPDEDQE